MGERCRWCDEDVSAGQEGICADCARIAVACLSCGEETLDDTSGAPECVTCMSKRHRQANDAAALDEGRGDYLREQRKDGEA